MKIIPEPVVFQWDTGNIDKNLVKHQVTNQEAEEVFTQEPLIVYEDSKHSSTEKRYQALGQTSNQRRLFISFTIRDNRIRIISLRDMSKKEEKIYEAIKTNS